MENTIKNLWQASNEQLEATSTPQPLNSSTPQQLLNSSIPTKYFAVIIGIIWVLLIDGFLVDSWGVTNWFFKISVILQSLLTKIAIGVYIYQLYLINKIDISTSVVEAQERLARLQSSTLNVTRILFLQLPLWTTFYWNQTMIDNGHWVLWVIQGAVTLLFFGVALWLYFNVRIENRHQRWFQWIFRGKEWDPMIKAMDMLDALKDFKQ
jgi:hypothetical protein